MSSFLTDLGRTTWCISHNPRYVALYLGRYQQRIPSLDGLIDRRITPTQMILSRHNVFKSTEPLHQRFLTTRRPVVPAARASAFEQLMSRVKVGARHSHNEIQGHVCVGEE